MGTKISQNRVALILQGGGALGAYQAGVYEALHHAGLEPDWISGVSIGAINGAIVAGNPPDRRLSRLRDVAIGPEHVMASGALPPALPMVEIAGERFWDGCLVSNTPLSHLLERLDARGTLVFEVDLFNARGPLPRDLQEAMGRVKDIQYSSRTRLAVDMHTRLHRLNTRLRGLLDRIPESGLTPEDHALRRELAAVPQVAILLLIYQQSAWEGEVKDYEFSAASMREHWAAGRRDTERTLARKEWLAMPGPELGIVVHDVHRVDSPGN